MLNTPSTHNPYSQQLISQSLSESCSRALQVCPQLGFHHDALSSRLFLYLQALCGLYCQWPVQYFLCWSCDAPSPLQVLRQSVLDPGSTTAATWTCCLIPAVTTISDNIVKIFYEVTTQPVLQQSVAFSDKKKRKKDKSQGNITCKLLGCWEYSSHFWNPALPSFRRMRF